MTVARPRQLIYVCKIFLERLIQIHLDTSCNNQQVDITRFDESIELSYSYIFKYISQLTGISFSSLILFMSRCANYCHVLNENSKLNFSFWDVGWVLLVLRERLCLYFLER